MNFADDFKRFVTDLISHDNIPKELIDIVNMDPAYFNNRSTMQMHLINKYLQFNNLEKYKKYIPCLIFYLSDQEIKGNDECSICLDSMNTDIAQLKCDHVFHFNCITEWKTIQNSCPFCSKLIIYEIKPGNKIKHNINKLYILCNRIELAKNNINKFCFLQPYIGKIGYFYLLYQLVKHIKINTTEVEERCIFDNIMTSSHEKVIQMDNDWKRICGYLQWDYHGVII